MLLKPSITVALLCCVVFNFALGKSTLYLTQNSRSALIKIRNPSSKYLYYEILAYRPDLRDKKIAYTSRLLRQLNRPDIDGFKQIKSDRLAFYFAPNKLIIKPKSQKIIKCSVNSNLAQHQQYLLLVRNAVSRAYSRKNTLSNVNLKFFVKRAQLYNIYYTPPKTKRIQVKRVTKNKLELFNPNQSTIPIFVYCKPNHERLSLFIKKNSNLKQRLFINKNTPCNIGRIKSLNIKGDKIVLWEN